VVEAGILPSASCSLAEADRAPKMTSRSSTYLRQTSVWIRNLRSPNRTLHFSKMLTTQNQSTLSPTINKCSLSYNYLLKANLDYHKFTCKIRKNLSSKPLFRIHLILTVTKSKK